MGERMAKTIKENMLIPYIVIVFIGLAFVLQDAPGVFLGLWRIQTNNSVLISDYILIGGIGAAFLNSGILMLGSYGIVRLIKLDVTGPIFAGILTIGGFAFFGKNIINVSIIYLGVYLYAKYQKISLKSVIVIFLFSTGIAPISSVIIFGLGLPYLYSIPIGIFVGTLSGFVIVPLASHVISFHKGFDLYNVGFAGGILVLMVFGIINLAGLTYTNEFQISTNYHWILTSVLIVICFAFITIGYLINGKNIKNYNDILSRSGRAITDFTRRNHQGIAMFNIGLTGLLVITLVLVLGIQISGPVVGALMTVIGFSAFGKHIKNVFPSMAGVLIAIYVFQLDIQNVMIVLALIFSTALAPLSGEHGILIGVMAGFLHVPLVLNLGSEHGGLLLYSNGFAAAFTAVIVNAAIQTFERRNQKWRFTKL